jgi:hypothetical protein
MAGTSVNPNAGKTLGGCPPGIVSVPFQPGVSDGQPSANPLAISAIPYANATNPHPGLQPGVPPPNPNTAPITATKP